MKTKNTKPAPKKIANPNQSGNCDNCGNDLGRTKWVFGEHTGCTRSCVVDSQAQELAELDREMRGE